jgi:hypothetical protein
VVVLVGAGLASAPVAALDPNLLKTQPITQPLTKIVLPPNISSVSPSCVSKGGTVTVSGSNFGTPGGRALALSGPSHVDLTVSSWSANQIIATVPNTPGVLAGKSYSIGIENAGHAGWVSNTTVTVNICASLLTTTKPLVNPGVLKALSPGGGAPAPGGTGPEATTAPEGAGEMPADPGAAMPTPAGSPALLGGQLPPPPGDLPPPPPRHDKRSEPGEIVVVSANMAEAMALQQQAQGLGLSVKRRTPLKELGLVVTVLRVPKEVSVGNAIESLRQAQPNIWVDANHRLGLHGADARYGHRLIGVVMPVTGCGNNIRIGLIDTPIDIKHPALAGQSIVTQSFLTPGVTPASAEHGTATAALLVGKPQPNGFSGLVPGARLYAAAVFRHQDDRGADATAESVVKALNWLAGQNVQIINLNFGGQRNLLLEAAIDRLIKRGIVVVVAVGNDGSDQPSWPAAQNGVIAVTAVDENGKIYGKANRGKHVGFAAPGVHVWSVAAGRDGKTYTGTSYAAPFVTAVLAMAKQSAPAAPWPAILKQLQTSAKDLGDNGHDPVYGWGLIQAPANCRGR